MQKRLPYLLAAALATALIAAGCGDDDDDETTAGATGVTGATGAAGLETSDLSKTEWIEAADQICREGDQRIDQEAEELFSGLGQGEEPSEEQQSQLVEDVVIPEVQDQVDQIRELGAPAGDEQEVAAILSAAQSAIDQVEQDPSAIGGPGDPGAFREANRLAQDYGLTNCGG